MDASSVSVSFVQVGLSGGSVIVPLAMYLPEPLGDTELDARLTREEDRTAIALLNYEAGQGEFQ